jgi:hypothetical protein
MLFVCWFWTVLCDGGLLMVFVGGVMVFVGGVGMTRANGLSLDEAHQH